MPLAGGSQPGAFREHGLLPPSGAQQALGLHHEDCGQLIAQSVHNPELTED
ncbi:hypothetical protein [Streptomyces rochei]|uniref:hypothetical protein n=1 Tax=Streptomyces rochei TaxID=1928 RepID=UPI003F4B5619